jgi:CTP:molybdopterin cytidylyltransferase MocA
VNPPVAGLLLAAGAGRRYGFPKALAHMDGEPLLARGMRLLADGGCRPVLVVLGAQADRVRAEVGIPDGCVVVADGWAEGIGASLRAGLAALARLPDAAAVVVALVDQPYLGAEAVRRLASFGSATAAATATATAPKAPAATTAARAAAATAAVPFGAERATATAATATRTTTDGWPPAAVATYGGQPGHPVLLPRPAWAEVAALARGDVGARAWLRAFPDRVVAITCDGTGLPDDIDTPYAPAHQPPPIGSARA